MNKNIPDLSHYTAEKVAVMYMFRVVYDFSGQMIMSKKSLNEHELSLLVDCHFQKMCEIKLIDDSIQFIPSALTWTMFEWYSEHLESRLPSETFVPEDYLILSSLRSV